MNAPIPNRYASLYEKCNIKACKEWFTGPSQSEAQAELEKYAAGDINGAG